MKKEELIEKLKELNISEDCYSIDPCGMPNEKFCLVHEEEWKIFYSEKGIRTGEKIYLSEEEACEAFLNVLKGYAGQSK